MAVAPQLPILVTGASGQFGRLVLSELLDRYAIPADQIIATTRTPDALAEHAARGVSVRYADFDKPGSLPQAFAGASRMLMISTSPEAPYVDGKRLLQQGAAIDAARQVGLKHIIYTSAPNPEPGTPCFWKGDHYKTELALIDSGLDWTVLRNWEWPDWHFAEIWLPALDAGEYFSGTGGGRVNHVTREDCAASAAGALVSDAVTNRRFNITGAEPLSADEIMSILGDVAGKEVKVIHGTPEALSDRLAADGVDPALIPVFVAFARGVEGGFYSGSSDAVETLSGRKPETLRVFLTRTLNA